MQPSVWQGGIMFRALDQYVLLYRFTWGSSSYVMAEARQTLQHGSKTNTTLKGWIAICRSCIYRYSVLYLTKNSNFRSKGHWITEVQWYSASYKGFILITFVTAHPLNTQSECILFVFSASCSLSFLIQEVLLLKCFFILSLSSSFMLSY